MSFGLRRVAAVTAGALAVALTIGSASPALAQTASIDPSTLGQDDLESIIDAVGSVPLASTAGLIGSVGSADIPLDAGSTEKVGTPTPVDPTITKTEFLGI